MKLLHSLLPSLAVSFALNIHRALPRSHHAAPLLARANRYFNEDEKIQGDPNYLPQGNGGRQLAPDSTLGYERLPSQMNPGRGGEDRSSLYNQGNPYEYLSSLYNQGNPYEYLQQQDGTSEARLPFQNLRSNDGLAGSLAYDNAEILRPYGDWFTPEETTYQPYIEPPQQPRIPHPHNVGRPDEELHSAKTEEYTTEKNADQILKEAGLDWDKLRQMSDEYWTKEAEYETVPQTMPERYMAWRAKVLSSLGRTLLSSRNMDKIADELNNSSDYGLNNGEVLKNRNLVKDTLGRLWYRPETGSFGGLSGEAAIGASVVERTARKTPGFQPSVFSPQNPRQNHPSSYGKRGLAKDNHREPGSHLTRRNVVKTLQSQSQTNTQPATLNSTTATLAQKQAQFQWYLTTYLSLQSNLSALVLPVIREVITSHTGNLTRWADIIHNTAMAAYVEVVALPIAITGPFMGGMNCLASMEKSYFNGTNMTLATIAAEKNHTEADLATLRYFATWAKLLLVYNAAWKKGQEAANSTGLLDTFWALQEKLMVNETGVAPESWSTVGDSKLRDQLFVGNELYPSGA